MKKISITLFGIAVLFLTGCSFTRVRGKSISEPVVNHPMELEQTKENCEANGAEYRGFSNGCMNFCSSEREKLLGPVACTANAPFGCDCGEGNCWNGHGCERI